VKLRIHSGAAFDTQNKEGTMAMLADSLFPNETVKEFFREDLGGNLEVVTNYDYIQINASGNSDQFLTILETLANAVIRPQIDKETTEKVRRARLERIRELEKNSGYVADQAVSKRLFGDFPYGRSAEGTKESLTNIDFADLLLARQRFMTADNATIAVIGSVKPDYVLKATRQLFGGWIKADKKVPATFAQPNAPDTKFFLIKSELENASELRFAFRGLARKDDDFYAGQILTLVLQNRLQKKEGDKALLRQNSYFLPGLVILKFPNWNAGSLKIAGADVSLPQNFLDYVQDLLQPNVTAEELQIAKTEFLKNSSNQNTADLWLDVNSFGLATVKTDAQTAQTATLADVQRVLERWRKEAVVRTLLIKNAA
jgi:zinc protease